MLLDLQMSRGVVMHITILVITYAMVLVYPGVKEDNSYETTGKEADSRVHLIFQSPFKASERKDRNVRS